VDDGHVGDGNALGHGHEDVPSSARAGGGAIGGRAGAIGEPGEAAEGGLQSGGNARPVHSTAQNPFEDVMAQRGLVYIYLYAHLRTLPDPDSPGEGAHPG
jgi:hypothetical protein